MAGVLLKKEYLSKEEFELLMDDVSQAEKMLADYEKNQKQAVKKPTKKTTKKRVAKKKIIKA
jgi:hypothetical protein